MLINWHIRFVFAVNQVLFPNNAVNFLEGCTNHMLYNETKFCENLLLLVECALNEGVV